MAEEELAPPPRPRFLYLAVVATTLTGIMNNGRIGPAIPDILAEFDAPLRVAGWIVAAGSLPGILIAPTVGILADRFGRREILVPCLVLFALAGGVAGLAPSLQILLILRGLQGVGSAGLINLSIVVIGDHWSGDQRAAMIGATPPYLPWVWLPSRCWAAS